MKFSFKEKVVVITGASSGIGKELSLQLAEKGAKLILASRDIERLTITKEDCLKLTENVLTVQTDVSDKEQCKNLIDKTIEAYGRIDVLINNAGISMWAKFEEITDVDMFEKIMRINYLGSVYCTYYALPFLKITNGKIVAVSSLTGKTGVPTRTAYSASKHAIAGFFDSLRIELIETGVSVFVVYPGFVATEVRERALGNNGKPLGKSHLNEKNVMSSVECSKQIISAIENGKRDLVMTLKAKIGLWLKLINPKLVDKISLRSIKEGK